MTQTQLYKLTKWLSENIFRNCDVMFPRYDESEDESVVLIDGEQVLLTDIIASLHNLLCEAVTGNRYNYMFHWANKIGAWCDDDLLKEENKNNV